MTTTIPVLPPPVNQDVNAQLGGSVQTIKDNIEAAAKLMSEIREEAGKGSQANQGVLLEKYEKLRALQANNTTLREAWDLLAQMRTSSQTKNA